MKLLSNLSIFKTNIQLTLSRVRIVHLLFSQFRPHDLKSVIRNNLSGILLCCTYPMRYYCLDLQLIFGWSALVIFFYKVAEFIMFHYWLISGKFRMFESAYMTELTRSSSTSAMVREPTTIHTGDTDGSFTQKINKFVINSRAPQ